MGFACGIRADQHIDSGTKPKVGRFKRGNLSERQLFYFFRKIIHG
jgi:hypothetical protein